MITRMSRPPASNPRRLVGTIVVQDQRHVPRRRNCLLHPAQEFAELDPPRAAVALPDHPAAGQVQGRKPRWGAVAFLILGPAFDLAGAPGQQRRSTIQGLHLGLRVPAQHPGTIRWVPVQSHPIPDLFDKQRVTGQLKRLAPVRVERQGPPDAADRAGAPPTLPRPGAGAPVRRRLGRGFQGQAQPSFPRSLGNWARGSGARLLQPSVPPRAHQVSAPLSDRWAAQLQFGTHPRGSSPAHQPAPLGLAAPGLGPTAASEPLVPRYLVPRYSVSRSEVGVLCASSSSFIPQMRGRAI